jgi:hypothetical protein
MSFSVGLLMKTSLLGYDALSNGNYLSTLFELPGELKQHTLPKTHQSPIDPAPSSPKDFNMMTALVPIAYFVGMVDIVRVYVPPHTQTQ